MSEYSYIEPYRQFYGCVVPNWLMEQRAVGPVAKLVYGELAWQSSKHAGVAQVTLGELMERVGGTKSTVQRALKELEGLRLIESQQVGLNQANRYKFLDHPWIRRRPDTAVGNRSGQNDHTATDEAAVEAARSGQSDTSGVVNMTTPSIHTQDLVTTGTPLPPTAPAEGVQASFEQARGIVESWWDRQAPPPTSIGKTTLAKRVQRLIAAGWPDGLVEDALDLCENFTEAAIEGRLRGLRATGTGGMGVAPLQRAHSGLSVAIRERPDCAVCGGSGWVLTDEGAVRCDHGS